MFEKLIGTTIVPQRLQMHFHDNGNVEFRKREIVGQSSTEFDNTREPILAWLDKNQTLYQCEGYGNIPADACQLTCSRYFFLELHNILSEEEKPPEDGALDSPFLAAIAESRAIQVSKTKKPRTVYEKLTLWLGASLVLEIIVWGIRYAVSG